MRRSPKSLLARLSSTGFYPGEHFGPRLWLLSKIALRASSDTYERAEKVREAIARQGVSVTTSEVLRMALEQGLTALEKKFKRR